MSLRLFASVLLAVLGRPIMLARTPTPPVESREATLFTAIVRSWMPWPKQPFTAFEQTTPATEKSRRRRWVGALRRGTINGILKRAQGRSCSPRSSLGGEFAAPSETLHLTTRSISLPSVGNVSKDMAQLSE